jgi:DeoR family fructose operon transcriptional repressor
MPPRSHRQEKIRQLLVERGRLSVEDLAQALGVTTMTIRRDLGAMERAGVLTRTHGGCVPRASFVSELPFDEKDRQQPAEKHAIAREAVRRLKPGERIYLDTGTTAVHVARLLPTGQQLHVFTNNLLVAMELFGRASIEVVVFGGALGSHSPELVGELALDRIHDFRFDVAVLGADAVDAGRGEFYSADLRTAMLSQAAQEQTLQTIVLADSTKFGKHSHIVAGRLTAETVLITDQKLDGPQRAALEASGAEIVYALPGDSNQLPHDTERTV